MAMFLFGQAKELLGLIPARHDSAFPVYSGISLNLNSAWLKMAFLYTLAQVINTLTFRYRECLLFEREMATSKYRAIESRKRVPLWQERGGGSKVSPVKRVCWTISYRIN